MQVVVTSDKSKYNNSDEAMIVVHANDHIGPIEGVDVRAIVTASNGFKQVGTSITRTNGEGAVPYKVNLDSGGAGIYVVDVTAWKTGFDVSQGSTSFKVIN
jgi:hypothetical protein